MWTFFLFCCCIFLGNFFLAVCRVECGWFVFNPSRWSIQRRAGQRNPGGLWPVTPVNPAPTESLLCLQELVPPPSRHKHPPITCFCASVKFPELHSSSGHAERWSLQSMVALPPLWEPTGCSVALLAFFHGWTLTYFPILLFLCLYALCSLRGIDCSCTFALFFTRVWCFTKVGSDKRG